MNKNKDILIKTLKKYENHLNIKLKLICNHIIIYDEILDDHIVNSTKFYIQGKQYVLECNSNIDLELIIIGIEEYLLEDNLLVKAIFQEINEYELNLLKDRFHNSLVSLVLIQIDKKNEHLYSMLLNIFEETCIKLKDNQIGIISTSIYDEKYLNEVKDTLESELYCKVRIAVSRLFDLRNLSDEYKKCCYFIELSMKFNLENMIIHSSNLLLPYIIDSVDSHKIEMIQDYIQLDQLKLLDEELMLTIKMFLKCNLSISETARKMYLHRNTLIYRIEKILSITGFDIRNFKDALKIEIGMMLMKK